MDISRYVPLVTVLALFGAAAPTSAGKICRPAIKIVNHELGRPTNLRRIWVAHISVDASACQTDRGIFSLRILRSSENAPDHEFVEPLLWRARQRTVVLEFWIDEAVQSAEVADVADCPCRDR